MRKLTKFQKKKYVKRSKLIRLDAENESRVAWQNRVWAAIDKMPDGDIKTAFIRDAELEQQQTMRVVQQRVAEDMRRQIDRWAGNALWFIGGTGKPIQATGSFTPGEFVVPDEVDKDSKL